MRFKNTFDAEHHNLSTPYLSSRYEANKKKKAKKANIWIADAKSDVSDVN